MLRIDTSNSLSQCVCRTTTDELHSHVSAPSLYTIFGNFQDQKNSEVGTYLRELSEPTGCRKIAVCSTYIIIVIFNY